MNKSIFFLILLYASPLLAEDIYLAIGESHSIASQPLQKIVVQKKGLFSLYDHKSKITLTGKKLGTTELKMGSSQYNVHILHRKKYRTLIALKSWAKNKRGPKIHVINKEVVLKGSILLASDWLELQEHCHSFCDFKNQATLSDSTLNEIKRVLDKKLSVNNLTTGPLSLSPHFSLKLPKSQKKKKTHYKEILSPYGVDVQFDSDMFQQNSTIEIQVYVAHLKRSFLRQWGVQWPSQLSASVAPGEIPEIGSVQVALNALEASGNGQLLASPTLVTESGKQAQFHSGGEFPIQTRNAFNNSVNWKRYGLSLKTTPTSNAQKNLNVKIDLEISTLDHSQAVNGVPGLNRSHLNTQITVKSPRPILLSGFLQRGSQEAQSGLPWLSQIPIFSPLFASGEIHNTEYELVFILLPRFYSND